MPLQFLFAMRASIIFWVTVSLFPIEHVYDAVEAEIDRQGGNT